MMQLLVGKVNYPFILFFKLLYSAGSHVNVCMLKNDFLNLLSQYTSIVFIFKANRHELQATKLPFDFMVSLN